MPRLDSFSVIEFIGRRLRLHAFHNLGASRQQPPWSKNYSSGGKPCLVYHSAFHEIIGGRVRALMYYRVQVVWGMFPYGRRPGAPSPPKHVPQLKPLAYSGNFYWLRGP